MLTNFPQKNYVAPFPVRDFIFCDFKITADGECSHEMKTRVLLGRKAMTNLVSILKSRDISLPIKM